LIFPGGGTAIVTGTANYKTISADGITATLSGVISGATTTRAIGWAGGNATTPGPGTIVLAAANTYTKTNVLFSGTLQVAYAENAGISGPLGKSTGAGFVVFRGGTLQYSSANNYDYSGRFSTAASQQYNIDVNGQSVTFNTALTSSGGALTLTNSTGSGTLTLTAANTYSGGTTINAGTLALGPSGSIASTPTINVAAGATLDASQPGTLTVGASQTLNSIGSVLGSLSVNGGLSAFMTTIGTNAVPSASANVTFNPSSTYVWDINKATGGTAGADPGWGLLSVPSGTITITTPLTINIVSLNGSDQPGNAANFNNAIAYSFPIAYASGGIGSFNASQVAINTAGFANYPTSASQWSVSLDNTGNYLLLNFNPFQVITTVLTNENVAAGGTAIFVVKANAAGSNPGFQWTEGSGYSPLANGGTSLGGANVSITTNGNTSTLTLSGVQDADTGSINVNVTATFNSVQQSALSSANLFVVDAPSSVSVSSTLGNTLPMTPVAQGAAIQLTATPYGGNGTLSYQWYLGATAIAGATNSFYQVNVSPATVGTYNCVVTNLAGSVTGSPAVVPGPVTSVANQMIFEPYNYIFQSNGGTGPWDGIGVTNVYNQLTGAGLGWVIGNTGSGDGACLDVNWNQHYVGSPPGIYGQFPNDNWPWEGLADSFDPGQAGILPGASGLYEQTGGAGSTHLPFGAGGSITNGTVYFSWVMNMGQGGAMTTAGHDYVGGFGYNNGDPTTFNGYPNAGIYLQTPGDDTYRLGVFKTSTGTPNPGVNGNWASSIVLIRDTTLFAVCRLTVRTNGGSSVALWIDPPTNSFYASEANVPPPDVVDSDSAGAPDAAPSADYFYDKWSADITSRNFAILRVGTTWASVTPPAAPTLSVNNVLLTPCAPATAVFTSQNAGNPVTAGYGWTFDNGGGPVALSDGPNPNNDGSAFSGTATDVLTITGVTAAEVGTYTVTGTNIDQNTVNTTPVALVGSASGTLSFLRPALSIAYNGAALVVSWPTNTPACFALNQTANLAPPVTWASASGGTAGISGTNHTYTVTPPPAAPKYYRLVGAP
jgi:autotransporter-associated beta strand protein